MTIAYQITDTTGNQVIDGGGDLAAARRHAQSLANKWGTQAYLCERGADEDDFETFAPVLGRSREELRALLAEMASEGLRTASGSEPGWYWTSLGGTRHWVTYSAS